MGQGSLKELVKTHENTELEIGPRMPNERKRPREPTSNVMGQESPSSMDADPITILGRYSQVKEKVYNRPKRGPASTNQMTPQ